MRHSFSIDFGGFKIRQSHSINRDPYISADLHRLTPQQFDALMENFEGTDEKYLTTESGKDFRMSTIMLGGVKVTIYADVPAHEVDPNQLSMLDA